MSQTYFRNYHRTYIEIDRSALEFNIKQLKKVTKDQHFGLVVKSNAYGHGIKEISLIAEKIKEVNWLLTAGIQEAINLRKLNIKKNILVMSYLDGQIDLAIALNISLTIYNLEDAYQVNSAAKSINKIAVIHIKIDTGMCRLGVYYKHALNFISNIQKLSNLKITGIFTHLSDTSNPNTDFSYTQLKHFDLVLDSLDQINININNIYTHALSSSGLYIQPNKRYNLIRVGALAYGLWKSDQHKSLIIKSHSELSLRPVMSWKTKLIQIKTVPKGSFIGYDKSFFTKNNLKIGILPIGYYDGISRHLSNKSCVIINKKYVKIIGNISMNLMAVDLTNINAKLHDEATLNLADYSNINITTNPIPNEVFVRINSNIPRIIKDQLNQAKNSLTKLSEKNCKYKNQTDLIS